MSNGKISLILAAFALAGLACGDDGGGANGGQAGTSGGAGGTAGGNGGGPGGGAGGQGGAADCSASGANGEVFQRLAPSCEGCHGKGASKPYFASLQAFEDLLAYDEALVKPGQPAQSRLVALLRGTATGNYSQMPLGAFSFAALAEQGKTAISVGEIESWITSLPPRGGGTAAAPVSPTVRRLSAPEMVASLDAALGLTQADLFKPDNMPQNAKALPIQSPTALKASVAFSYNGAPERFERWQAIGGGNTYLHQAGHPEVTQAFVQTMVQVGQARCRLAVDKPANEVFFRSAGPDDTSAAAPQKIKANIGQLARNVFAERIEESEQDTLFQKVFVPYEKAGGPRNGWVAVCSVLLRDPRFFFY